jgi:NAD(P)-dependent dehydrogenase (short-subunit alcohol dehydrogenase family)
MNTTPTIIPQKILITGASGGFGHLTVKALLQKGHQVAAAMRDPKGKNLKIATELETLGALVVEIDVTNDESVTNGIQTSIDGLGGLDVLINNAGVGSRGMIEFYTPEDFQKLFDINLFGVQRMNRAVLPFFRAQNKGLIVYTSSLLGRITMPFYGLYQTTKWALEALASNYRVETSTFGIENCIVEPGGFPTPFADRLMQPSDTTQEHSYGEFANAVQKSAEGYDNYLKNNPQQDPQKVAEAFVDLIELPYGEKPFRTTVDFIGMDDAIKNYNEELEQITTKLYTGSGNQKMLKVQK